MEGEGDKVKDEFADSEGVMVGVGNVLGFGLGDVDDGKGDIVGESVGFSYPMGVYVQLQSATPCDDHHP